MVHRLERICFCVENGEWPMIGRFPRFGETESRAPTPMNTALTPRNDYMVGAPEAAMVTTHSHYNGLKLRVL